MALALLVGVATAFAARPGPTAADAIAREAAALAATTTATAAVADGGDAAAAAPAEEAGSVRLAFAGDVMFEEPIRSQLAASPRSVLAAAAPILKRADIAVVNLETAVTTRGEPAPDKGYNFRAPASAFAAIRAGGVDVVSLANNHGMDYGATGLRDTLRHAKAARVPVIGAGLSETAAYAPYRKTVNGQRIAILAASQVIDDHLMAEWTAKGRRPGMASAYELARLERAVREARATSDTVVVYLHWGAELEGCPTDKQQALARSMVRAGADIIVGTHAHIPLGAGRMGKALVAYGLGNFVFYASREDNTRSGVLEVTVTGREIDRYRWLPMRIRGGLPVPAAGSERATLLRDWVGLRGCTGLQR